MIDSITSFTGEHYFLSNFYHGPGVRDKAGEFYPTAEHLFQASKLTLDHHQARWLIRTAPSPDEAKRLGRGVPLRPDWEEVKRKIMFDIVWQKFDSYRYMRDKLITTGDSVLVEGNTWGDRFWGATSVEGHGAWPHENGKPLPGWPILLAGHNWLGRILMMVRELIND